MSELSLFEAVRPHYRRPTMEEINARPKHGLTCVGSFSGCGGSSLGLRMAGWDVRAAVEFIPAAADTYRANFPETLLYARDIRNLTPEMILEDLDLRPGELDLFEGSPPCASFSAAGAGSKDWGKVKKYSDSEQRTDDLFWEWSRILEGLKPRAFIAENVPGMIRGPALEEYAHKIIRDLSALGYRVNATVLNSSHYGVPQDRRRLIFLGWRNDVAHGLELPVPPDYPAKTTPEPLTLADALAAVSGPMPEGELAAASMEKYAVGRSWKIITEGRAAGTPPDFSRLPCQRCGESLWKHTDREVTSSGLVTKAKCADGEKAEILKDYFSMVVPELDRPCPTVTATGSEAGAASVTHPTECRKFVLPELLSICGFPEDFKLTGTFSQRYERMGRAVTPPLYEAMGRHIATRLGVS
jgi:DNA (cytosine-5)-methyltransferase 1